MQPTPIGTIHRSPTRYGRQGGTFSLLAADRRKHLALFGKSGTGKSTLLSNLMVWDIRSGLGITVLDPHGSLCEGILEMIPSWRTNDVIYFNPAVPTRTLGINILEKPATDDHKPLVVSALISIFKKLWGEVSWGPRLEDILRNAAFALMEQPEPVSLVAIPRLLTDASWRMRMLTHVTNPVVRAFFAREYEQWTKSFHQEAIAPVLNKVRAFIANPLLRSIIGQATSSFDFRWVMDHQKILLCNLAKGALGEDVSALLGSLIVTKLFLAALSRQNVAEEDRRLHVLYADEIQNFIYGVDFPTILSEARKYRLALHVATQTLEQLDKRCLAAIFGNCATIVSFRVSGQDAKVLEREFAMLLPASDLQDLPDYKAYLRSLIQGDPDGPYGIATFPPLEKFGDENERERVVSTSLERFSRPRAAVEAKLNRFLSR